MPVIMTNFTVYGHDVTEIQNRAQMVARRFFGELEPHLDYEIAKVEAMCNGAEHLGLWRADVHAEWPNPTEFSVGEPS